MKHHNSPDFKLMLSKGEFVTGFRKLISSVISESLCQIEDDSWEYLWKENINFIHITRFDSTEIIKYQENYQPCILANCH